jgi:hypothetical protein
LISCFCVCAGKKPLEAKALLEENVLPIYEELCGITPQPPHTHQQSQQQANTNTNTNNGSAHLAYTYCHGLIGLCDNALRPHVGRNAVIHALVCLFAYVKIGPEHVCVRTLRTGDSNAFDEAAKILKSAHNIDVLIVDTHPVANSDNRPNTQQHQQQQQQQQQTHTGAHTFTVTSTSKFVVTPIVLPSERDIRRAPNVTESANITRSVTSSVVNSPSQQGGGSNTHTGVAPSVKMPAAATHTQRDNTDRNTQANAQNGNAYQQQRDHKIFPSAKITYTYQSFNETHNNTFACPTGSHTDSQHSLHHNAYSHNSSMASVYANVAEQRDELAKPDLRHAQTHTHQHSYPESHFTQPPPQPLTFAQTNANIDSQLFGGPTNTQEQPYGGGGGAYTIAPTSFSNNLTDRSARQQQSAMNTQQAAIPAQPARNPPTSQASIHNSMFTTSLHNTNNDGGAVVDAMLVPSVSATNTQQQPFADANTQIFNKQTNSWQPNPQSAQSQQLSNQQVIQLQIQQQQPPANPINTNPLPADSLRSNKTSTTYSSSAHTIIPPSPAFHDSLSHEKPSLRASTKIDQANAQSSAEAAAKRTWIDDLCDDGTSNKNSEENYRASTQLPKLGRKNASGGGGDSAPNMNTDANNKGFVNIHGTVNPTQRFLSSNIAATMNSLGKDEEAQQQSNEELFANARKNSSSLPVIVNTQSQADTRTAAARSQTAPETSPASVSNFSLSSSYQDVSIDFIIKSASLDTLHSTSNDNNGIGVSGSGYYTDRPSNGNLIAKPGPTVAGGVKNSAIDVVLGTNPQPRTQAQPKAATTSVNPQSRSLAALKASVTNANAGATGPSLASLNLNMSNNTSEPRIETA